MKDCNRLYEFDETTYDLLNCVLVFNQDNSDKEIWIEIN